MRLDPFQSRRTTLAFQCKWNLIGIAIGAAAPPEPPPRLIDTASTVLPDIPPFQHAFGNLAAGALDAFDAETARRLEELEQR